MIVQSASEKSLPPIHYRCPRINGYLPPTGHLDRWPWNVIPRSTRFVDIVTGLPGFFDTRMAAVWSTTALHVAVWVEEPCIRAEMNVRDSFLWKENVVEVFLAGDDCYYELQINAINTIYEAFFINQTALSPQGRFAPFFESVSAGHVDVLGGFQDRARFGQGRRWVFPEWDLPGLETAVHCDGVCNIPEIVDRGWNVEISIPWKGLHSLWTQDNVNSGIQAALSPLSIPPSPGQVFRAAITRIEHLEAAGEAMKPTPVWALTPHGVYDCHRPECFSRFQLSHDTV